MIKVQPNEYHVTVDATNPRQYLPSELGMAKGDLIIYKDAGYPAKFSAGTAADKVLVTDPSAESGWTLKSYSSGGGGGGSSTITLINNTGATILAGTVVTLDEEGEEREIRKATSADGHLLFIASDDVESGDDIECYAMPNQIVNVLCTSDAVAIGDKLQVSSTAGSAEAGDYETIGTALSVKEYGDAGFVKCLLAGGSRFTAGTTDLEDGVSALPTGHIYFFYEPEEEEEEE